MSKFENNPESVLTTLPAKKIKNKNSLNFWCSSWQLSTQFWVTDNTRTKKKGEIPNWSAIAANWNVKDDLTLGRRTEQVAIARPRRHEFYIFNGSTRRTFGSDSSVAEVKHFRPHRGFQLPSQPRRHALEIKELWFGGKIFSPDKAAEVPASTPDCNSQVKWQRFSDYESEIEHDPPPPGSGESWLWSQLPL